MKQNIVMTIRNVCWVVLIIVVAFACQSDENELTTEQKELLATDAAESNLTILSAAMDVMDITSDAFGDKGIAGGRQSTIGKKRGGPNGQCIPAISGSFDIDRTHRDSLIYTGSFIIDYGDGKSCSGDSTRVRKGRIIDTFTYIISFRDSLSFSVSESISFEGFYKDSISIDGTFTSVRKSSGVTSMNISGAKLTYADGTSATWSGTLDTRQDEGLNPRSWDDDIKTITGSVTGVTRGGSAFSASITSGIVYRYECFNKWKTVPVSGVISITAGGDTSTVDYGDGTCDKTYSITVNGETTTHTFDEHKKSHG